MRHRLTSKALPDELYPYMLSRRFGEAIQTSQTPKRRAIHCSPWLFTGTPISGVDVEEKTVYIVYDFGSSDGEA